MRSAVHASVRRSAAAIPSSTPAISTMPWLKEDNSTWMAARAATASRVRPATISTTIRLCRSYRRSARNTPSRSCTGSSNTAFGRQPCPRMARSIPRSKCGRSRALCSESTICRRELERIQQKKLPAVPNTETLDFPVRPANRMAAIHFCKCIYLVVYIKEEGHDHGQSIPLRQQPGSPVTQEFRFKTKEVEVFRRGDESSPAGKTANSLAPST